MAVLRCRALQRPARAARVLLCTLGPLWLGLADMAQPSREREPISVGLAGVWGCGYPYWRGAGSGRQSTAMATTVLIVDDHPSFRVSADRKSTRLNSSHANISYA